VTQTGAEGVTVLVVEDELAIRQLLAYALGRGGLTVLTAGQGDEAVELYRAERNRIDLVLLDVQMSPWDGPRTLAELRQLDPDVRAVFMSGSTDRYTTAELLALGAVQVFPKPFPSMIDLVGALKELAGPELH
jgi:two-component system, OmpR family, response regulator